MAGLKFIHAADIHLGSTIQLPQLDISKQQEELLEQANYNAFSYIVEIAIAQKVDFLLLAGDVYDQQQRSIKANQFFKQQCQKLAEAEIAVYIIAGNHDPLNSRQQLFAQPDNVYEFSGQEVEEYQIAANNDLVANIIGQSYQYQSESEALHLEYQSSKQNLFNIALLHTQLEAGESNYVPATKNELMQKQMIDYWALGHIHQCRIEHKMDPAIAYPGIPQGRDFGEQNLGGCFLVEVGENHQIDYSFVPTSNFVWQRREISLQDQAETPSNLDQLIELIQQQAQELAATYPQIPYGLKTVNQDWQDNFVAYLIEWNITGAGEIHQILREQPEEAAESLITSLNQLDYSPQQVITAGIKFNTRAPMPSLEELKSNNQVFAELSNVLKLCDSDLEQELKEELGEIWSQNVDHEDVDPTTFQLTTEAYQDILKQAKNLIIEEVLERRD